MFRIGARDIPAGPVDATLQLIDSRWKGCIVHLLLEAGRLRYGELHRRLSAVSTHILTKQLRELEGAGLITRTVSEGFPPCVEYRLTSEGESLRPLIEIAEQWGKARMARQYGHSRPLVAEVNCPR